MPPNQPDPTEEVPSPCIRVCTLDENQVCIGCGRTLQEIADWPRLTNQEKQKVTQKAQTRRPTPSHPDQSTGI